MTLRFDLGAPEFLRAPEAQLARMRACGAFVPVRLPIIGTVWVTTTYAATEAVAKGKETFFLDGRNAGLRKGTAGVPWWLSRTLRALISNMLTMDDPDHRRLRRLVDRAFARRGIREMRPAIAAQAEACLAGLGSSPVDIVPGFCRKLPLEVIADLLGVPQVDRITFARAGGSLGDIAGPLSVARMLWQVGKLGRLIRALVAQARAEPRAGLISDLIAVEEEGDRLSEDELLSMVFMLLFAGFETTTNLISGAVLALAERPEQRAWLTEDFDGRIEQATEEFCRYCSAVAGTKPRLTGQDIEVDGHRLRRGNKVMALPLAANYDPSVFEHPEELRLDRFPNPHLSFSTGAHFCLGMQLARVELQEALRAVLRRWPDLPVDLGRVHYARRPGHRALKTLFLH